MSASVFRLFEEAVESGPKLVALSHPVRGNYVEITWNELKKQVSVVSNALMELSVEKGDRVAIISNTRLEWTLLDLGIFGVAGVTVPLYHSINDDDYRFILGNSDAKILFVENGKLLERLRKFRNKLPLLKNVVLIDSEPNLELLDGEMTFADFTLKGKAKKHHEALEKRLEDVLGDDLATIVYTSGTTGEPKGAMITHDNLIYEAHAIEKLGIISAGDIQLIFLPLAHIFARILQIAWLKTRHVLVFAESIERLSENIKTVRPTVLAGVPRVFEKIHASIVSKGLSSPGFKKRLVKWAFDQAEEKRIKEMAGDNESSISWSLAEYLVFSKIRSSVSEALGGRLRFLISGGAALSPQVNYFFKFSGVTILEGWGLTETSAATCLNIPTSNKIGTVGKPIPGTEIKIDNDGEILVRGRGVFKGYWKNQEATREAFDQDGYFKTGDVGIIQNGFLKITDRKKDVIVTAGGKKVAPQKIENVYKNASPLVSQVLSFGDARPYLVGIFTLDEVALKSFADAKGITGPYQALTNNPLVRKEIQSSINEVNAGLSSFEQIKKFEILDHDFEVGDQLTPTLKVRRRHCEKKYAAMIDGMYQR